MLHMGFYNPTTIEFIHIYTHMHTHMSRGLQLLIASHNEEEDSYIPLH